MVGIKRFFECYIPVTVCNLKCPYCYIIQEERRSMRLAELKYDPKHIARALNFERVGGPCLFSICGGGETLAQKEVVDIVYNLLKEGHYVNVTTNGTLSKRFDELLEKCAEYKDRLHISFSLHYFELLRLNLIDVFYSNINKLRKAGVSVLLQMNLCDEYIAVLDEIKRLSLEKAGAYPQIALTRNEKTEPMSIYSDLSEEEYFLEGEKFDSPLFRFTFTNFNVKRKEFCYAGDWSGVLDLETGILKKCYNEHGGINIFEDIDKPIPFKAVGSNCKSKYCINSSHFLSLGVIPELKTPSYAGLRNRTCVDGGEWMTPTVKAFLSTKLCESNEEYTRKQKKEINKQYEVPISTKIKAYVKNKMPQNIVEKYDQVKNK